jgi:hypothetical protein
MKIGEIYIIQGEELIFLGKTCYGRGLKKEFGDGRPLRFLLFRPTDTKKRVEIHRPNIYAGLYFFYEGEILRTQYSGKRVIPEL